MIRIMLCLTVLLSGLTAYAEVHTEGDLPPDFGQVSIEASRRALESYMQDWQEDLSSIESSKNWVCFLAEIRGVGATIFPVPSLELLKRLHEFFKDQSPTAENPAMPLHGPLAVLARLVEFTPDEQKILDQLMNERIHDFSELIRQFIDTQWFLIRVSYRLYGEQMNYHLERTKGFWGFFRSDREYCEAYTLQYTRDQELIQAAHRVLAFYYFLEREEGLLPETPVSPK